MSKLQQIIGIMGSLIVGLFSLMWLVVEIAFVEHQVLTLNISFEHFILNSILLVIFSSSIAINCYHIKLCIKNPAQVILVGVIRFTAAISGLVGSYYLFFLTLPLVLVLIISAMFCVVKRPGKLNSGLFV